MTNGQRGTMVCFAMLAREDAARIAVGKPSRQALTDIAEKYMTLARSRVSPTSRDETMYRMHRLADMLTARALMRIVRTGVVSVTYRIGA